MAIWVTVMAMPARPSAATAEPALKPNQPTHSKGGPDHAVHEVVRGHVLGPVASALAEEDRADKSGNAGIDVHHRATGEVEHARVAEEATAPHPMGDGT